MSDAISAPCPSLPHQVASLAVELCSRLPKGVGSTPALLDASFSAAEELGGLYGFTASGMPPSGRGELLLLLLNALRNASFVPSNERTIGHSARAVQVRIGAVDT